MLISKAALSWSRPLAELNLTFANFFKVTIFHTLSTVGLILTTSISHNLYMLSMLLTCSELFKKLIISFFPWVIPCSRARG